MSVPPAYHGLWQRSGIWRSDGSSDLTSRVLWFQGDQFHIDLRVKTGHTKATAFAGVTVVDGERCEWRPEIAFPRLDSALDAGIMHFLEPDRLHERGVDGSYAEEWLRIDAGPVTSERAEHADGAVSFVIKGNAWMALAHGPAGRDADSRFCFARRADAGWRIALCQDAAREGEVLPATDATGLAALAHFTRPARPR